MWPDLKGLVDKVDKALCQAELLGEQEAFGLIIAVLELLNLFIESLAFFCDSLPLSGPVIV
jgi:hypothetical protein